MAQFIANLERKKKMLPSNAHQLFLKLSNICGHTTVVFNIVIS